MAVTAKKMALIVGALGFNSSLFGIFAETKKPARGTSISGKGVVICKSPSSPTVAFGYFSTLFLVASTVVAYLSLFYPYKGKSVPHSVLFKSTNFTVFFNVSLFSTGLGLMFLLWPTITGQLYLSCNVHIVISTQTAPQPKQVSLVVELLCHSIPASSVALMLAINAREDFFEDMELADAVKGAMQMTETQQGIHDYPM